MMLTCMHDIVKDAVHHAASILAYDDAVTVYHQKNDQSVLQWPEEQHRLPEVQKSVAGLLP